MPDFEVFTGKFKRHRRTAPPTVTITRRSVIVFSAATYDMLGEPESVVFHTSRTTPAIGFEKADRGNVDAHAVKPGGRTVQARALCTFLGLDLGQSRRYPLLEQDGLHYIDLSKPGKVVTANRRVAGET